jgi:primosomal protein N'
MASGLAHCRDCGTALLIEVEEPRCECGYLLYRLEGETCPECGREIPVAERWVGVGVGESDEGTEGRRD